MGSLWDSAIPLEEPTRLWDTAKPVGLWAEAQPIDAESPLQAFNQTPQFDPEGTDYDYETAQKYGLTPDESGHFPSRVPETGQILKGRKHPTFHLTEQEEQRLGNAISKGKDGTYYSLPKSIKPSMLSLYGKELKEQYFSGKDLPQPVIPERQRLEPERKFLKGLYGIAEKPLTALGVGLHRLYTAPAEMIPGPTREAAQAHMEKVRGIAEPILEKGVTPEQEFAERTLEKIGIAGVGITILAGIAQSLPQGVKTVKDIYRYTKTKAPSDVDWYKQFSAETLSKWGEEAKALKALKGTPEGQRLYAEAMKLRGVKEAIKLAPSQQVISKVKMLPAPVAKAVTPAVTPIAKVAPAIMPKAKVPAISPEGEGAGIALPTKVKDVVVDMGKVARLSEENPHYKSEDEAFDSLTITREFTSGDQENLRWLGKKHGYRKVANMQKALFDDMVVKYKTAPGIEESRTLFTHLSAQKTAEFFKKPTTPKALEPLAKEAKSMEELDEKFAFHVSKYDIKELEAGTFFGTSLKEAMSFAKTKGAKYVYAVRKSELKPVPAKAEDIFGDEWIKAGFAIRSGQAHKPVAKIPILEAGVLEQTLFPATIPAKAVEKPPITISGDKLLDEMATWTEIPAQETLPDKGTYPAIRTEDGSIFFGKENETHIAMIENQKIPPAKISSGGWLADGIYTSTGMSDTIRLKERVQVIIRVKKKRLQRQAVPTPEVEAITAAPKPEIQEAVKESEEAGFLKVPSGAEISDVKTRVLKHFDLESPFKKIGAPKTGLAIKLIASKKSIEEEKAIDVLKRLRKFNLTAEEQTKLALVSERPSKFFPMTPEQRKRFNPAYQEVRRYFAESLSKLRKAGVLQRGFFENVKIRLQDRNMHLRTIIEQNPANVEELKAELKQNLKVTEDIAKGRLKFVHIPAGMWFDNMSRNDPKRAMKIMRYISQRPRETLTIESLIKAEIIKPEEVNIFDIIGSYGRRIGKDLALADIFKSAKAEGLIRTADTAPDEFVTMPARMFPMIRGHRVSPLLSEYMQAYMNPKFTNIQLSGIMGMTKMMQFYNPLFLPMYDVVQGAMLGSMRSPRVLGHFKRALVSSIRKDKDYWESLENGMASKPYSLPYNQFRAEVDKLKSQKSFAGQAVGELFKGVPIASGTLKTLYSASWGTAWKLDELIRLTSYHYLKAKGKSPQEAAQLTALFHADYAAVPAETRRLINKVLFTPTFKIAMAKLHTEMLAGTLRHRDYASKGMMGSALLATAGILLGTDYIMRKWGFEREQISRRYVKRVEVEGEDKELVITFSNPANIWLKYAFRFHGSIFNPSQTNKVLAVAEQMKWELHPLLRIGLEVLMNEQSNGDNVYNPFGDTHVQAFQTMRYMTGQIVRIASGLLEGKKGAENLKAFKALQLDVGKLRAYALKPITFIYVRQPERARLEWQHNRLNREFGAFSSRNVPRTDEEREKALDNFLKRLEIIEGRLSEAD